MTIDDLYEQHRELIRLGNALMAVARREPLDMLALVGARRAVAQMVVRHLADEARLALQPLRASPHGQDQALAREYTGELLRFRQLSSGHQARWSGPAIAVNPIAYRRAVQVQLDWIAERRKWEEAEFLPAAARLTRVPARRAG